jgi:hypothetical protein
MIKVAVSTLHLQERNNGKAEALHASAEREPVREVLRNSNKFVKSSN